MALANTSVTDATSYTDIAPAVAGDKAKLKSLYVSNYEAAGAAVKFLILYTGSTEIARFPLPAGSVAPLILRGNEADLLIPMSKMVAGDALRARLSATGTMWVVAEYFYGVA